MTQAFNLGLLANKVNSSGNLDASSGLVNATPIANGGTNLTTLGASGNMLIATSASAMSAVEIPSFGFKNRIINGAMVIDQRNAGASVTANSGVFPVDRFQTYATQSSKLTCQQSTTVPANFKNSVLYTSSSAYSVLAGDYFSFTQRVEGFNVADFNFGTASATTVTLSFWVRSSLTGTFGGACHNNAFNRVYPFSYTIFAANTWEQKTITIAGDTSGTWTTDNSVGLEIGFSLGCGSTGLGTAGAWAGTSNIFGVTGQVNIVGTSGATFYITGVQLEKGSTATSFDYRPYGTELALCQRYYTKILSSSAGYNLLATGTAASTSSVGSLIVFPVTMRAGPTFSYANILLSDNAVSSVVNSIGAVYAGNNTANVTFNGVTANLTLYRPTPVIANNTSAAYIDMTAEL
jgi:hypothetical protein